VRLPVPLRRERIAGARLGRFFACSLALHAALIALVSLRACSGERPPPITRARQPVDVELTVPSPPRPPKTMRPGGGVPATLADSSPHPSHHRAHQAPARSAEPVEPQVSPTTPPLAAEAPADEVAPVAAPVDAVAAPSPRDEPPDDQVDDVSRAAGPTGTGPGVHGGPGGRGAGAGGAEVPVVAHAFAFGRTSPGPFKGVACFIARGVLRIADVHGCAPVAVFYTDSFNVSERQQPEGFPGISDRATWFMIEYQGAFTVGEDGIYAFRLHSDDGSYLFIDGTMVIENDGKHKPESRSGSIALRPGAHQLRLLYAQTTDRMALQLFVRRPGAHAEQLFVPHI
jgi:hypothetical protein